MAEIKQWITSQDGIDKLTLSTAPAQMPGDQEVLVKILAVSLNYRDTEGQLTTTTTTTHGEKRYMW